MAESRRKAGGQSGLPGAVNLSLPEALTILTSQNDAYKHAAIMRSKDLIAEPALTDIAALCVRFGELLAPVCNFMMGTSDFPLLEVRTPFAHAADIDRLRSMVGTRLWTCPKFPWPVSKSGDFLSPLLQLNLEELHSDLRHQADFPSLLVQVWGDQTTPVIRVIPLAEIASSSPDVSTQNWENAHLYYGVTADASGSANDAQGAPEHILLGEFVEVGPARPFAVCRGIFNFETIRYEIERLSERPQFSDPDVQADIAELIEYLSDEFELASAKFEAAHQGHIDGTGFFFGDSLRHPGKYGSWFLDKADWHGGGWKMLFQPWCDGDSMPGLYVLWDGQLALLWRFKDGKFEFRAWADC